VATFCSTDFRRPNLAAQNTHTVETIRELLTLSFGATFSSLADLVLCKSDDLKFLSARADPEIR